MPALGDGGSTPAGRTSTSCAPAACGIALPVVRRLARKPEPPRTPPQISSRNYDRPAARRRGSWSRILPRVSIRSRTALMVSDAGPLRIADSIASRVANSAAASSRAKPLLDDDSTVTACHFMVRIRRSRASISSGGFDKSHLQPTWCKRCARPRAVPRMAAPTSVRANGRDHSVGGRSPWAWVATSRSTRRLWRIRHGRHRRGRRRGVTRRRVRTRVGRRGRWRVSEW